MTFALSDAMDVLIVVVPQFMQTAPSPEQLEVVARTLFAEEPTLAQREVRRDLVSTLMNLLLRIRLNKEKWGSFYHLGDFAEASLADEGLTEALVNTLTGDESEQTVTSNRAINMLVSVYSHFKHMRDQLLLNHSQPNLQVGFYQVWAVLFQPSAPNV